MKYFIATAQLSCTFEQKCFIATVRVKSECSNELMN